MDKVCGYTVDEYTAKTPQVAVEQSVIIDQTKVCGYTLEEYINALPERTLPLPLTLNPLVGLSTALGNLSCHLFVE